MSTLESLDNVTTPPAKKSKSTQESEARAALYTALAKSFEKPTSPPTTTSGEPKKDENSRLIERANLFGKTVADNLLQCNPKDWTLIKEKYLTFSLITNRGIWEETTRLIRSTTLMPNDVPDVNATVLYVGNLDKRVTDQMMLNILRTGLGHIKDKVLSANMYLGTDMANPENSCYVQFADNSAANQALNFLNGRDFCGKKVKVSWATNSSSTGVPKVIGTSVAIYVGNLDDTLNESDLTAAFDPFGEIINVKIVRDPVTNKSKNIGFVSYTNKPDAETAIRDMNGAVLKGRAIKTNWATRNTNPKKDEHDYDSIYKSSPEENQTIYVGGIPNHATDDMIRDHFTPYGRIDELRIFAIKNYAFIKFESHQAAATAICKTNGSEISGSVLKVWWSKEADTSTNSENSHYNRSSNAHHSNQQMNQQTFSQGGQFNPYGGGAGGAAGGMGAFMNGQQQQQQYLQYMQYYQYWMQHYQQMQMQMQQQGGGNFQQQQHYQNYPQQQQQRQGQHQGQQNNVANDEKPAQ